MIQSNTTIEDNGERMAVSKDWGACFAFRTLKFSSWYFVVFRAPAGAQEWPQDKTEKSRQRAEQCLNEHMLST